MQHCEVTDEMATAYINNFHKMLDTHKNEYVLVRVEDINSDSRVDGGGDNMRHDDLMRRCGSLDKSFVMIGADEEELCMSLRVQAEESRKRRGVSFQSGRHAATQRARGWV